MGTRKRTVENFPRMKDRARNRRARQKRPTVSVYPSMNDFIAGVQKAVDQMVTAIGRAFTPAKRPKDFALAGPEEGTNE